MSNIEEFEKYWYKPLYDSMKFDGNPDKDLFRYKDLGKQSALLSWIECSRLKDAIILDLQAKNGELEDKLNNPLCTSFLYESRINELKKMCQKLYNALNCAHGYIDPYENKRTDKICMDALCEYEKVRDNL